LIIFCQSIVYQFIFYNFLAIHFLSFLSNPFFINTFFINLFLSSYFFNSFFSSQLPEFDENGDDMVSLEEYNKQRHDFIFDPELSKQMTKEEIEAVKIQNRKDTRRFIDADLDQDGRLNRTELAGFLHPHSQEHMHGTLLKETFEEMDTDQDGKVDVDEYLDHMRTQTVGKEKVIHTEVTLKNAYVGVFSTFALSYWRVQYINYHEKLELNFHHFSSQ